MAVSRPAIVGSFVLGGLALVVAGILFFGGSRLFAHTTRAVIFFDGSVAGLDVGSPVTFRGVRVGSVQHVTLQLSRRGGARIPVIIELVPGQVRLSAEDIHNGNISVEKLVEAGLRAQLNLQSFVTGQLRIDLDFRPSTPPRMVDANEDNLPQIPALPSDLERLRATLSEIPVADLAKSAQRTLETVENLTQRLDKQIGPLLDSSRQTLDTATRTLNTTDQSVAQLREQATQTLEAITGLANAAQKQLDGRGADLQQVLKSAQRAADQANALLVNVNQLTSQRSDLRGNLNAAVRDLAASASSLRGFTQTIERDPSTLLRGRR
ncbi:MAG TPA: MlaD family protein [Rhodopila sp.]|uniref:MlaD family protein n=1 Tax=Rhodopila sp. TaxID=2480087 RepID=UPI002CAFDE08|nr:MlaD family protein [Rhodopila sp.]HVY16190.1 MlaD family protein [Rhodopila sp.]